jgi:hypothetical protein
MTSLVQLGESLAHLEGFLEQANCLMGTSIGLEQSFRQEQVQVEGMLQEAPFLEIS